MPAMIAAMMPTPRMACSFSEEPLSLSPSDLSELVSSLLPSLELDFWSSGVSSSALEEPVEMLSSEDRSSMLVLMSEEVPSRSSAAPATAVKFLNFFIRVFPAGLYSPCVGKVAHHNVGGCCEERD